MKDIELPPPLGYMNAGHVHELQQGRLHYGYVYQKGGTGAEEAVYTEDQLRAAVEADGAQRVPDGLTLAAIGHKHFGNPIPQAWYAAAKELLASTPAPAQQEPMEAFLVIDLSRELGVAASELAKELRDQGIGNYSVNMALPKAAADAMRRHFKAAITHQEPPQQERKPTLPPGHCASDWGGRPTGPCLYTDDEVMEILAAHGIKE